MSTFLQLLLDFNHIHPGVQESKYLLPSSTVQAIFEDIKNIAEISHMQRTDILKRELEKNNIPVEKTDGIVSKCMENDTPYLIHQSNTSQGSLSLHSQYTRNNHYAKYFKYVELTSIYLGMDRSSAEVGVESVEDLPLVHAGDLDGVLTPMQARKLLQRWAKATSPSLPSPQALITPNLPDHSPQDTLPLLHWDKLPQRLKVALDKKQRPVPSDRRELLRNFVDDVMVVNKKPGRKILSMVAAAVVAKYTRSHSETQ